jgi:hypothetical protein
VILESLAYARPAHAEGFHWNEGNADAGGLYRNVAPADSAAARMGFWSARITVGPQGSAVARGRAVAAPLWAVALVCAVLPALWLAEARRAKRRRRAAGLCPACGYDLRASSDCCPECGTKFAPAPPIKTRPAGGSRTILPLF